MHDQSQLQWTMVWICLQRISNKLWVLIYERSTKEKKTDNKLTSIVTLRRAENEA